MGTLTSNTNLAKPLQRNSLNSTLSSFPATCQKIGECWSVQHLTVWIMQWVLKVPNTVIFNQRCFYKQKPVAAKLLSERIKLVSKKVYKGSWICTETCQNPHCIYRSLVRTQSPFCVKAKLWMTLQFHLTNLLLCGYAWISLWMLTLNS